MLTDEQIVFELSSVNLRNKCSPQELVDFGRAIENAVCSSKTVCHCDMRTKMLGDGCSVCNPEYADDHMADDEECDKDARIEALEKIEAAARNVFRVRGRHNSQIAMCRLGELLGERVTWPEKGTKL